MRFLCLLLLLLLRPAAAEGSEEGEEGAKPFDEWKASQANQRAVTGEAGCGW